MIELYQNNPLAFWIAGLVIAFLMCWFFWWLPKRKREAQKQTQEQNQSQTQKQEQHVYVSPSISPEDKKEIAKEVIEGVKTYLKTYLGDWANRSSDESRKQTFDDGIFEMDKKEWNKAIEIFRRLLPEAEDSYKGSLLNQIGLCFYNQSKFDQALGYYKESLELAEEIQDKEGIVANLNNMGLIYDDKENYDIAIRDYTKIIEIDPNDAIAFNNRGAVYDGKGDYDTAIRDYNKAIELNPKLAETMANMGIAYEEKGDKKSARLWYEKAIEKKEYLPDGGEKVRRWIKSLKSKK